MKKYQWILLIIVLTFTSILILSIHYNYSGLIQEPYHIPQYYEIENHQYLHPIHADEWAHLAQGLHIKNTKHIFENPYDKNHSKIKDLELGYHLFLALVLLIPISPLIIYSLLPTFFFLINSFFLFLFIKKFTKSYWVGLLSILFFSLIPSNTNLLGNWFATPLTFSFFFLPLSFLLLDKALKQNKTKYWVYLLITLTLAGLSYPLILILTLIMGLIYLIIDKKIYIKHKTFFNKYKKIIIISTSIVILLLIFLFFKYIFTHFIFDNKWSAWNHKYSPIFTLFQIFILPAIYLTIKNKIPKTFLITTIILGINILSYNISTVSFIIPYQRTIYYYYILSGILLSIGFVYSIKIIIRKINPDINISFNNINYKSIFILAISLAMILSSFSHYQEIENRDLVLINLIDDSGFNALSWLKQTQGENNVIFSNRIASITIPSISNNYIVAMESSNLWYREKETWNYFLFSDCTTQKYILKQFEVDYIVTKENLICNYNKIFDNGTKIYDVI